jgi:carbamoyl-phosphate synthase large subunit
VPACGGLLLLQVMGIDKDFASAYAKAQIAAGQKLPTKGGKVFLTMADKYKKAIIPIARDLGNLGFGLVATGEVGCYLLALCKPMHS